MRDEVFPALEQSQHLLHGKGTVINDAYVDDGVWSRPNELYSALQFVSFLHLDHIALAVIDSSLYRMQEGWIWFALHAVQTKRLPELIQPLLSSVATTLAATPSSRSAPFSICVESVAEEMSSIDVMVAE